MNTLPPDAKIQVFFSVPTEYGTYQDTLYYTQDQWALLSEQDLDVAKQQRVDAWVAGFTGPGPDPITPEQAQAEVDRLKQELANAEAAAEEAAQDYGG